MVLATPGVCKRQEHSAVQVRDVMTEATVTDSAKHGDLD
jgi:hypothetical protein